MHIINCVQMVMCILKLMNIPMTALSLLASTNLYSLNSLREPLLLQPLYDLVNFHNKHLCQVTVLFKLKEFFLEEKIGQEIYYKNNKISHSSQQYLLEVASLNLHL